MKFSGIVKLACLLALPLAAFADARADYASQWQLALGQAGAGAYRVVLDREVYRQARMPGLQDVVVANADGATVATAVFPPDAPLARALEIIPLPWFPLPVEAGPPRQDIAAISEIASDGSLRRVELRGAPASAAGDHGFVLDASRLRAPIAALRVTWNDADAFDRGYRVEASDDLRQWRAVEPDARLVQLRNGDRRVTENRIVLPGVQARYLRLLPQSRQAAALQLASVEAELALATAAPALQWEDLQGRRVEGRDGVVFEYTLDGRFPVQAADVALPGNSTRGWTLESRDDAQAAWQPAASPWVAYRVDSGGNASTSPPQVLHGVQRSRHWRLRAREAHDGAPPVLRLGYRPEVVVFLAEGTPPFALLAGSARATRPASPLPQLIEALRGQRGKDWQPATATLGTRQPLAGDAALQPAASPPDWKRWLLWALLVAGAALVAGFAFSLLRGKPAR